MKNKALLCGLAGLTILLVVGCGNVNNTVGGVAGTNKTAQTTTNTATNTTPTSTPTNTSQTNGASVESVSRIVPSQTLPNLPDGYKVQISWFTAQGINMIPFVEKDFQIVDGWQGTLDNKTFKVLLYQDKTAQYTGEPRPYIMGVSYDGKAVGGLSVVYPPRWLKFSGENLIFSARYGVKHAHSVTTKYYALNLLTGKFDTNQSQAKAMSGINDPNAVDQVKGLSKKYSPLVPNADYKYIIP